MPKVLCTLPNASEEISGVKFVSHANGMLSEDVSDEVAASFASIPGYEIVGKEKKAAVAPEGAPAQSAAASKAKAKKDAAAAAAPVTEEKPAEAPSADTPAETPAAGTEPGAGEAAGGAAE